MEDKTLERIIKFFNKINCPIKICLKKTTKENSVNGQDIEYVVIYGGQDIMFSNKKDKKFEFEEENGMDLRAYCGECFQNSEKLLKRLKEEGYQLIYRNNKQSIKTSLNKSLYFLKT